MKYYFDTEFIEKPNFIELISIGIKCEDGRTLYAESTCFDERKADEWVKTNVIKKLRWYGNENSNKGFCNCSTTEGKTEVFGTLDIIRDSILDFIGDDNPEFWAYYADYDWVVFCWLFGSMINLPDGWPMYCKDLKQLMDHNNIDTQPAQDNEHNALDDAIWNEELHKYIIEY